MLANTLNSPFFYFHFKSIYECKSLKKQTLIASRESYFLTALAVKIIICLTVTFLAYPSVVIAKAGFTLSLPDSSVVLIEDSFGRCSGTRIANSGYILTARHCFNACLIRNNLVDVEVLYPEFGWQSPKLYHFPNNTSTVCSTIINGISQNVQIVSSSTAFMVPSEQSTFELFDKALYMDFLEKGYLHNGDYAVIKIIGETKKHSCRKVAPLLGGDYGQDEAVRYVGYPGKSSGRPTGFNSDGNSLYISHGHTTGSILDNSCLKINVNKKSITNKYDRPELLLSTVDDIPGASGSALLNPKNEIIGVINSVYMDGVDVYSEYCSGSTVAIKISHIINDMKKRIPSVEVSKAFDCQLENY